MNNSIYNCMRPVLTVTPPPPPPPRTIHANWNEFIVIVITGNTRGEERLDLSGVTFEEQAESLVNDILRPLSYHLIRFTKLPYLAEGDRSQPFYKLEDAVFVLSVM